MTPAEQVVKALREQASKQQSAALDVRTTDATVALSMAVGSQQMFALADFVEATDAVRWGGDYDTAESWDKVLREYDAALARLAEVLS